MNPMKTKLDGLWSEYRAACPDPEASPDFMPGLWRKVEARRAESTLFRRLAQIWVMATAAVTLLIGAVLMPSSPNSNNDLFYSGTYVDILADELAADYSQALPVGDYR